MADLSVPTVFLIDDDEAVLDSLQALLEAEGFTVATFHDALSFLERCESPLQGCLVSDVRMPGMDGLELLAALRRRGIAIPVVLITAHGDVPLAVRAMKQGALDFIEKPFAPDQLIAAVHEALRRRVPSSARPEFIERRLRRLTAREREVLEHLVRGLSNKMIARELGISPRTVEIHRAHVMAKLEAGSLPELVRQALAAGIVPVDE